jgi:hypothetical protein
MSYGNVPRGKCSAMIAAKRESLVAVISTSVPEGRSGKRGHIRMAVS